MKRGAEYQIELHTLSEGWDGSSFYVHARGGSYPSRRGFAVVVLMQKAFQNGSDLFGDVHQMTSDDSGISWTGPTESGPALNPRIDSDGRRWLPSGLTPTWHEASGRLLAVGNTVRYVNGSVMPGIRPMETSYSVFTPENETWSPWRTVVMPDLERYYNSGSSGGQRFDLPDGDILQPIHFRPPESITPHAPLDPWNQSIDAHVAVMRCRFDGVDLECLEVGPALSVTGGRGLLEPSLTYFSGRYFLTIRNNNRGYVAISDEGLIFTEPLVWHWDDGEALETYNTQQHWVVGPASLHLVYTRRGANNDHVARHRAPLFMAEVDTERLCVVRQSERIIVPERGARLGNFGVIKLDSAETLITVSEWMQGPASESDPRYCERFGSNNAVFAARIKWRDA